MSANQLCFNDCKCICKFCKTVSFLCIVKLICMFLYVYCKKATINLTFTKVIIVKEFTYIRHGKRQKFAPVCKKEVKVLLRITDQYH